MHRGRFFFSICLSTLFCNVSLAQTSAETATSYIQLTGPFEYETGDTFLHKGRRLKLYGVQSCMRGTDFYSAEKTTGDCGAVSIAMLATYLVKLQAACQPVGETVNQIQYVVCAGRSLGNAIDIGEALIVGGFAFAATKANGDPVHPPYLVAELIASESKSGLWKGTFTHPVKHLLNGIKPEGISR